MRIKGKVSWYNHRDGFGQLIDEAGIRYFFDHSVLKSIPGKEIATNREVEFQVNPKISNVLCATKLKLLPSANFAKKRVSKQLTLFEADVKV